MKAIHPAAVTARKMPQRPISTSRNFTPLVLAVMLILPSAVQAQFNYTISNGAVTITGYSGPGGAVEIPDAIEDLPVTTIKSSAFAFQGFVTSVSIPGTVTTIGDSAFHSCVGLTNVTMQDGSISIGANAFDGCLNLTRVTIPNSLASIGGGAFLRCSELTNISIPDNVTNIGSFAFAWCYRLSSMTLRAKITQIEPDTFLACGLSNIQIPSSVTSIGLMAFSGCTNLASVTIPTGVTNIGSAFAGCTSLRGVYFWGNAPNAAPTAFNADDNATIYYLPGTTGWGPTFAGRPTAPWLPATTISGAGSFSVHWANGKSVVVEAATSLVNPAWTPISTNTITGGMSSFSDPDRMNHALRFYRVRAH